MTKADKAKEILELINNKTRLIHADYVTALADVSAHEAGYKSWRDNNPDDGVGGWSMNPYNVEAAKSRLKNAEERYNKWAEIQKFANDTFLDMIKE